MKSARTSRHGHETPQQAGEPVRTGPVPATGAAPAAQRTAQGSASGAGLSWRLPSGQLLTEYALRTCFTGPLLNRTPFERPAAAGSDPRENPQTDASSRISQELRHLQEALAGKRAQAANPVLARGRAARRAVTGEQPADAPGKPRSRR